MIVVLLPIYPCRRTYYCPPKSCNLRPSILFMLVVDLDPYLKASVTHSDFFFPHRRHYLSHTNSFAASFLPEEDRAPDGSLAQNHCSKSANPLFVKAGEDQVLDRSFGHQQLYCLKQFLLHYPSWIFMANFSYTHFHQFLYSGTHLVFSPKWCYRIGHDGY